MLLLSHGLGPLPPYFGGRFSNGPVWVERLAERLHLGHPKEGRPVPGPSLDGGTNYAFGGAETGPGLNHTACASVDGKRTCVWNLGLQIERFFADGRTLDGDELIVVQGGANNETATYAAAQLAEHVSTLVAAGGKFFLVPNLDRLSQFPGYSSLPDRYWDRFVDDFNAKLTQELDSLEASADITVFRADWLALEDEIIADPASFGLTNVTDPACPGCAFISEPDAADTVVPKPDEYLIWDEFHWTAAAQEIFGDAAADLVEGSRARIRPLHQTDSAPLANTGVTAVIDASLATSIASTMPALTRSNLLAATPETTTGNLDSATATRLPKVGMVAWSAVASSRPAAASSSSTPSDGDAGDDSPLGDPDFSDLTMLDSPLVAELAIAWQARSDIDSGSLGD